MSNYEDNYVFLSSDIKPDIGMQSLNKSSRFYTHLPSKLHLSEDYEVAIADISYCKTWFNLKFPEKITLKIIDYDIESDDKKYYNSSLTLPVGHFETSSQLLFAINDIINKLYQKNKSIANPPLFYIDNDQSNKVRLSLGNTIENFDGKPNNKQYVIPNLTIKLCEILGFVTKQGERLHKSNYKKFFYSENQINLDATALISTNPVKLEPINSLYIYTDIIEPRIVGNMMAPLLRQIEIPIGIKFGDNCHIKLKKRYYHPLKHFEIDNILISITDESGQDIEFNGGRTSLALHFRRRKDKLFKTLENIFK